MKDIITNELQKIIGRLPTSEELDLCFDYVEDYFGDDFDTTKDDALTLAVAYFVDENMERCSFCGEYELCHNMIKSTCNYFCTTTCEEAYYNELQEDMHDKFQSYIYNF